MNLFAPLHLIAFGTLIVLAESAGVGVSFLPQSINQVPDALAFFPLTAASSDGAAIVSEGVQQNLTGSVNGTVSWTSDALFGYVLACSKQRTNSIILDPVPIGGQGHFAVNMWFKSNTSMFSGNAYAYLLSAFENATLQNSEGSGVYAPNSLQLMLPEAFNNRSGLLRAVVKDSDDSNQTSTLDSDGNYNDNVVWGSNPSFKNVSDGSWHMVTITTRTDVQHGFLLYIDGQAAAQLPPSGTPDQPTYNTTNATYFEDGGNPIYLDGNVFLCSRTDGDADRFFSGSVAQVGFFNQALNATSIQALYTAVNSSVSASSAEAAAPVAGTAAVPSTVLTIAGTECAFPFAYQGQNYSSCVSVHGDSRYCRDTNGNFLQCSNTNAAVSSAASSPVSSPALAAASSPAPNTVPSAALTNASPDSGTEAGQHGHGLSGGAIAGIVIGSIAGAVLLGALATFVILKKLGPGGHARLQEAPSSKFLMHSSSMDRQMRMSQQADAKEARSGLFQGPDSSGYNIRAKS